MMGLYMRAPKSSRGMSGLRKDCDSLPEKSHRLDEAMDCAVADPAEAAVGTAADGDSSSCSGSAAIAILFPNG